MAHKSHKCIVADMKKIKIIFINDNFLLFASEERSKKG